MGLFGGPFFDFLENLGRQVVNGSLVLGQLVLVGCQLLLMFFLYLEVATFAVEPFLLRLVQDELQFLVLVLLVREPLYVPLELTVFGLFVLVICHRSLYQLDSQFLNFLVFGSDLLPNFNQLVVFFLHKFLQLLKVFYSHQILFMQVIFLLLVRKHNVLEGFFNLPQLKIQRVIHPFQGGALLVVMGNLALH